MMFGSSSPFGASTPSLFGGASASSSPFGSSTSTSPFGMSSASNPFAAKPFGASTTFGGQTGGLFGSGTATGVFGASQAAPFGSSTPAFGSSTSSPFGNTQPAFGTSGTSSVFGQKPASPFGSFGSTPAQSNPFGAPSFGQTQASFGTPPVPSFGATTSSFGSGSMPAFGSSGSTFSTQPAPAFGNPFGGSSSAFGTSTPVFGQTSPAFGSSSPAFGSTTSAFGTGAFGSQASSAFGSSISFGSGSFPGGNRPPGSRVVPYAPKSETDGASTTKLISISGMDAYKDKSHEELRWEDYQAGDKGGPAPITGGVFGQNPSSTPFASTITSSPNPFAASTPFQQPKPATSFPSFTSGTTSFGTSTSVFGAATTPAISSSPSFGSFTSSSNLFNSSPSFSMPSSTGFGVSSGFGVQPANSLFPTQQTQPNMFNSTTPPLFGGSSTSSAFTLNNTKPAGLSTSAPTFFSTPSVPAQTTPSFTFPSSQPGQPGIFGSSSTLNVASPFSTQPISNTMAPIPAPVSAPFGTLPAMPQMSIGRASGSNPSVQYGISSIPVSEKPTQMRSNSLLTPRHITPRSKIRMHARKSTSKKDSPKISFFSDGEEAPVTPKADVSFIPRENPRALFIHQVSQSPATPVAAKRAPDAVNGEHNEDFPESRSYPAADDDTVPRETSVPDWSPDNSEPVQSSVPRSAEKVPSKSSKQNGLREESNHRGNGYISMTGHRAGEAAIAYEHGADIEALMPKLRHSDYYTEPRLQELAAKERAEPGYCRRVPDFIVGRKGYGHIKFLGETDVRRLDIEGIIQFNKCEVLVYMDESKKPPLGQGLNKPASVTLLNVKCIDKSTGQCLTEGPQVERFEKKLKKKTQAQGAEFVSFDAVKGEWTFRVKHFSRYGFDDSDESEDDEAQVLDTGRLVLVGMDMMEGVEDDNVFNGNDLGKSPGSLSPCEEEEEPMEELRSRNHRTALPHSLPAQLRLNPMKMQQLKSSFFPLGEDEENLADLNGYQKSSRTQVPAPQYKTPFVQDSQFKHSSSAGRPSKQLRLSPHLSWQRSPQQATAQVPPVAVHLVAKPQRKSTSGFRLEESQRDGLICKTKSGSFVDAALFMGTSFRVGWGPHGVLVHAGSPIGQAKTTVLSSCITFEKVALDRTARDDRGKTKDNLLDFQFNAPLSLHMSLSKTVSESNGLKLRSLVCNKVHLERLCDAYEDLIEKQHGSPGICTADQVVLKHQLMVWQLISVLFGEKEVDENEAAESMADMKARMANIDPDTERLARKAEFSSWLQDSVFHLVQADLDSLEEVSHLKDILILLSGKQVEQSVRKAVSQGDVRLACLLSQAAGSVFNREDISSQLEIWESEDVGEDLIEKDRIHLFKLLGGDVLGALSDHQVDWKRFLGMLMWYMLPPEAELPDIIHEFQRLVEIEDAPKPTPMYLEEAPKESSSAEPLPSYDSAYYLMLLHADGDLTENDVVKMFSSSAATFDRLDHRAAWHQKSVLQAIGVLTPFNSYILDMSFASQLLAAGLVHWAIYVVLHMPPCPSSPDFHEKVIKEILTQYCEVWSNSEAQQGFLEKDLSIPTEWLHEILAVYCQYSGDFEKSLDHYLKSFHWQDAHVLFMTKVSASLFLSAEHTELWNLANQMEAHKMEIENWDLGAGLYIDFLTLKSSFQNDAYYAELEPPVEVKTGACKDLFERLRESQRFWETRSSNLVRVAFARMADEVATLLVAESKLKRLPVSTEKDLYAVALEAPVPEDVQLCRLQGAVSSFASWITEGVTA